MTDLFTSTIIQLFMGGGMGMVPSPTISLSLGDWEPGDIYVSDCNFYFLSFVV